MDCRDIKFPGLSLFALHLELPFALVRSDWYGDVIATEKKITLTFAQPLKIIDGKAVVNTGVSFEKNSLFDEKLQESFGVFDNAIVIQRDYQNKNNPNLLDHKNVIKVGSLTLEFLAKVIYYRVQDIIDKHNLNLNLVSASIKDPKNGKRGIIDAFSATYISPNWKTRYGASLKNIGINDPKIFDKLN